MLFTGNFFFFADLPGKERQGKKGNGEEEKENGKREGGKFKMEVEKSMKMSKFSLYFFAFHFFETTENCFGSTKKKISTWKKHFMRGKNLGMWLCPPPPEKHSS